MPLPPLCYKIAFYFLVKLCVCLILIPNHAHALKKQVLLLHSYDKTHPWTDNILDGMLSVLNESQLDLEIYVEYMDGKRHPPEISFLYLEDLYLRKYGKTSFDIILLSDNNALKFIVSRRHRLFSDVPIVFCGVNNFHNNLLAGQTGITGIAEKIDISGTIALAQAILPTVQKFVVVNDETPTGRSIQIEFEQVVSRLPDKRLTFETWNDISAGDLQARLGELGPGSAVLIFTFHRDKKGQWFSIPEYLKLITDSSKVPSFSFWDHYLGQGILGGVVVSGEQESPLPTASPETGQSIVPCSFSEP